MMNFYLTPQWRQLRETALKLFGSECMNCGRTPEETQKPPHVDHAFPRSKFPSMELQLNNLQILCEDCNCNLKGTKLVDYRLTEHVELLEKLEGGKHKLTLEQKVLLQNQPSKKSDIDKDYECRRAIEALRGFQSKRKQQKRLKHLINMYGEDRIRTQLEHIK